MGQIDRERKQAELDKAWKNRDGEAEEVGISSMFLIVRRDLHFLKGPSQG